MGATNFSSVVEWHLATMPLPVNIWSLRGLSGLQFLSSTRYLHRGHIKFEGVRESKIVKQNWTTPFRVNWGQIVFHHALFRLFGGNEIEQQKNDLLIQALLGLSLIYPIKQPSTDNLRLSALATNVPNNFTWSLRSFGHEFDFGDLVEAWSRRPKSPPHPSVWAPSYNFPVMMVFSAQCPECLTRSTRRCISSGNWGREWFRVGIALVEIESLTFFSVKKDVQGFLYLLIIDISMCRKTFYLSLGNI